MILTREKILEEIEAGNLAIDPFDPAFLGPASYDLQLGDELRILDAEVGVIDVTDEADYVAYSNVATLEHPFVLAPGQTILGITRERVRLSSSLCGWLEGRSRFARLGLMIHVTAGFIAPGVNNRQVLEIANIAPYSMRLHAGVRIAQLVVQRTEGDAVYCGRFARQMKI